MFRLLYAVKINVFLLTLMVYKVLYLYIGKYKISHNNETQVLIDLRRCVHSCTRVHVSSDIKYTKIHLYAARERKSKTKNVN